MTSGEVPLPFVPSLRRIAATTAIAAVAAAVLLATLVLPAEYNIDPLGTGRALGLMALASPPLDPVESAPAGDLLVPTVEGPAARYAAGFKSSTFEFTLQPYEYVEYKFRLEEGASMLYAWETSSTVLHDFHGERASVPSGVAAEETYDKRDRNRDAGSFIAPFVGIHGWYWENPGAEPIAVRLVAAGFFTSATEIRSDRSRHPHALFDPAGPASASASAKSGTQEER